MERLSIDEVIAHCKRHTERMESHSGRSQLEETPIGNSNIMKQYWEHRQVAEWLEQLKSYEDAEKQGLILRPKCRLGDIVYALWSVPTESKYVVYPAEVKEINISSTNARKMIMYKLEPIAFRGRYNKYYDDDFGKLVFMSQEEAEKALKQMGE